MTQLLKVTYGVWDHIKNRCANRDEARNWALEWIAYSFQTSTAVM